VIDLIEAAKLMPTWWFPKAIRALARSRQRRSRLYDAWLILTGQITLHMAWQAGYDEHTMDESTRRASYPRDSFVRADPAELISYIDSLRPDASKLLCQCRDVLMRLTAEKAGKSA